MFKIPAHHQVDPEKQPGQIVFPVETPHVQTLGDYIAVKQEQIEKEEKKKMTFGEWWNSPRGYQADSCCDSRELLAEAAWVAALRENK